MLRIDETENINTVLREECDVRIRALIGRTLPASSALGYDVIISELSSIQTLRLAWSFEGL